MSDTNNQNSCQQKPCQSNNDVSSNNEELAVRPVLHVGVMWVEILRRFLIPGHASEYDHSSRCSSVCEPSPRIREVSSTHTSDSPSGQPKLPKLLEQQSPFVTNKSQPPPPTPPPAKEMVQINSYERKGSRPTLLASILYQVQEVSSVVVDEARQLSAEFHELVEDGKTTTVETVKTMRGEHAVAERYSAMAVCGLVGYLAAWRRGTLTKLVYSMTGVAAISTICYPEEVKRYNKEGLGFIRRFIGLGVDSLQQGRETFKPAKKTRPIETRFNDKEDFRQNTKAENTSSKEPHLKTKNNNKRYSEVQHKRITQPLSPNDITTTEVEKGTYTSWPDSLPDSEETQQDGLGGGHSDRSSNGPANPSRRGKLSMECQKDITEKIPYSPALPAPPKTGSDYYPQSSTSHRQIKNLITSNEPPPYEQKSYMDANNGSDPLGTEDRTIRSSPSCKSRGSLDQRYSSGSTVAVDKETSHNSDTSSSPEYHPLNKKLSRYYIGTNKERIEPSKSE